MRFFQIDTREDLTTVTLNHIENANSFGLEQALELQQILSQISSRVLLFQSVSSRFFCTGGNLKRYAQQSTAEEGRSDNRQIAEVLSQLCELPVLKVVWVNGDCFGGGTELISCFDLVWASPHSFLGFWQRKVALTFGWGSYARLIQRMKRADIKRLLIQGNSFSAYHAYQLGLVDKVFPVSSFDAELEKLIQNEQALPKGPLEVIHKLEESNEADTFEQLWFTPEHREILNQYKNKASKT